MSFVKNLHHEKLPQTNHVRHIYTIIQDYTADEHRQLLNAGCNQSIQYSDTNYIWVHDKTASSWFHSLNAGI